MRSEYTGYLWLSTRVNLHQRRHVMADIHAAIIHTIALRYNLRITVSFSACIVQNRVTPGQGFDIQVMECLKSARETARVAQSDMLPNSPERSLSQSDLTSLKSLAFRHVQYLL